MKNNLLFLLLGFIVTFYFQAFGQTISGNVADVWGTPIPDVNILVKYTDSGTQTDETGRFTLSANEGEILVFSAIGFGTLELAVPQNADELTVTLSPSTTKLKEVVVKKRKRKNQKELLAEYTENTRLIKTTFGILDKDRSSSSMQIIDGANLINVGTDFLTSLKNYVPGMQVVRPPQANDVEVYLSRIAYADTTNMPKAIFDVDGMIFETAPTYLSSSDIERLAVLQRNSAMSRYGPKGVGGVIIVNTNGKNRMDNMAVVRRYDNSALRDSLYDVFAEKKHYMPETPDYMEAFGNATTQVEARTLLREYRNQLINNPDFLLDLSYYFRQRWNDESTANLLLEEIPANFPNNVPALKSLGYRYQILGQHTEALNIFLHILKLDSLSTQSFSDVANAHTELGNREKAKEIYVRYKKARDKDSISFKTLGEDKVIAVEAANNEQFLDSDFNLEKLARKTGANVSPIRMVMTWSDENSNFGIQMINPKSQYDTWNTSTPKYSDFGTTQFFLAEEPEGEWSINLDSFEGEPTNLRIEVFFDYGFPSQRKKTLLFKLTPEYRGNYLFTVNTLTKTLSK
ncbi:MAG: carboxypeptidase-like regulatory domain-containing protein [Allomuricauda sp.]